jgi:hypothetical protein
VLLCNFLQDVFAVQLTRISPLIPSFVAVYIKARKFDFTNSQKVLQAMEIKKPKLVINLFGSTPSQGTLCRALGDTHWTTSCSGSISHHDHAEVDEAALHCTNKKIALFLKTCVLPLAIQTNALVIIHNSDCSFARAFSDICLSEINKLGNDFPFTVICFTCATWAYNASKAPRTIAGSVAKQSKRWRGQMQRLKEACTVTNGDENIKWQPAGLDLPRGCTHYVVADGITQAERDNSALLQLKASFVEVLSAQLPSVGFATMTCSASGFTVLPAFADYVGRNLPLVLLDSRPIPAGGYSTTLDALRQKLRNTEAKLNQAGTWDGYQISKLAHVHTVLRNEKDEKEKRVGKGWQAKKQPIWKVVQLTEELEANTDASATSSAHEEEDSAVKKAIQILCDLDAESTANRISAERKKLEVFAARVGATKSAEELDRLLVSASINWAEHNLVHSASACAVDLTPSTTRMTNLRVCIPELMYPCVCLQGTRVDELLAQHPQMLFEKRAIRKQGRIWARVAMLAEGASADGAKEALLESIEHWKTSPTVLLASNATHSSKYASWNLGTFLGAYDVLGSPCLYSGNLGTISVCSNSAYVGLRILHRCNVWCLCVYVHRIRRRHRVPED